MIGKASKMVQWGESVCMRDEDVHISETADGKKQVVLTLEYTEENIGLIMAEDF